jgi:hypothetical protein
MIRSVVATGMLVMIVGLASPALASDWTANASSDCHKEDGHVLVKLDFTNEGDEALKVKVTEVTFTGAMQTATVDGGEHTQFVFDVGQSPKPPGEVTVEVGEESRTFDHSATPQCGPTPTPPPTTPPPTTPPPTTPPPTTPPPTTPPPTTHTTTPPPPTTHTHTTPPPPTPTADTGLPPGASGAGLASLLLASVGGLALLRARSGKESD